MGYRIRNAYEQRFRALLIRLGARRLDSGVAHILEIASRSLDKDASEQTRVFEQQYQRLLHVVVQRDRRRHNPTPSLSVTPLTPFWCDGGLGGLARWLRAWGYAAHWKADIDDGTLIAQALKDQAILLTTDSLMMERRVLREGHPPALWIPPILPLREQLAMVLREYQLPRLESRCMNCGGELEVVDKLTMKDRIPPRTFLWLDAFFKCHDCGQLFWHGTHWERIRHTLDCLEGIGHR